MGVHAATEGVIARRGRKFLQRLPLAGTDVRVPVRGHHEVLRLPVRKDRRSRQGAWGRGSCSVQESGARAMARSESRIRAARRQDRWSKPCGFTLQQGPPFALRHSECSDLHIFKVTVFGVPKCVSR